MRRIISPTSSNTPTRLLLPSDIDQSVFLADDLLRSAITYKLIIVGEAAARISEETRRRFPEVPWTRIVGFRNQIVHGYFATDYSLVYSVASVQLPQLRKQAEAILDQS
jgi:uncharacterized protein with HEPN domain